MLLIHCPYCGSCPEIEFAYGGEAHIARPERPRPEVREPALLLTVVKVELTWSQPPATWPDQSAGLDPLPGLHGTPIP